MRKIFPLLVLFCLIIILPLRAWPACCNPNAMQDAQKILMFFYGLNDRADDRILSGQYTGAKGAIPNCYTDYIEALHTQTSKWVAMVGGDWGHGTTIYTPAGTAATQKLIDYWNAGHLITLSWHSPNPWTGGNAWDCGSVDLTKLITPGEAINTTWMAWLDKMAEGLAELQAAGVIVLWRPFHEVNGRWFWWGDGTEAEFIALWQHMFDYFTTTKELNNLLWVYCGSPYTGNTAQYRYHITSTYPGSAYVDINAVDVYAVDLTEIKYGSGGSPAHGENAYGFAAVYDDMVALGKPYGLGEYGPGQASAPFDYRILVNHIRDSFPETCFWQSWDQTSRIIYNYHVGDLLSDAWVITRSDLDWQNSLPVLTTQSMSAITEITAIGHGTITDTGGENATKRGICWNTTGSPTVASDNVEVDGNFSIGTFSGGLTGLTPATHYYVKAYAYNTTGYGYGDQVEFDTNSTEDGNNTLSRMPGICSQGCGIN